MADRAGRSASPEMSSGSNMTTAVAISRKTSGPSSIGSTTDIICVPLPLPLPPPDPWRWTLMADMPV
ncbi:hypothetical protein SHKM778_78830 [Streptomyces sp. KM77-8]|uniref:Uncharacterized protein n=1 Tax=Streptomyces haneummycinicus TaxID=3074435 RepID=A0AAT9HW32_9ACTN